MADDAKVTIKLDDNRDIIAFLSDELPKVAKAGMRTTMNKAIRPVVRAEKAYTPVRGGLLKRSTKSKVKTYPDGNVIAMAGIDRSVSGEFKGKREVPNLIQHLVDRGTASHNATSKTGKSWTIPGATGAEMVEKAFADTHEEAKRIAETELKSAIERAAAKEAARQARKK